MAASLSIHPDKTLYGREWEKKNTSRPHKGKGKLAKKMRRLNQRRVSHSMTLKSLPTSANPAGFKAPGSMQ